MPVILLYWFAAQQQTSTCRCHTFHSIYSNFSVKENELTTSFQNPQEMTKKLQKPNNTRKTKIYVFRGLRVNIKKWHLNKKLKNYYYTKLFHTEENSSNISSMKQFILHKRYNAPWANSTNWTRNKLEQHLWTLY